MQLMYYLEFQNVKGCVHIIKGGKATPDCHWSVIGYEVNLQVITGALLENCPYLYGQSVFRGCQKFVYLI